MIRFADVSHHQSVDLDAYFAAGHDRIALKVSEGTGFVDPAFTARFRYTRARGLPVLLYHYDRAEFSGLDQFDFFLAAILKAGALTPRDMLCLDSEDTRFPQGARRSATEFTTRAVARGFPVGCVYTGNWFARPNRVTPDALAQGWRQLWLSDYGQAADDQMVLPPGWRRDQVLARQYTDRASVPGVGSGCDYNRLMIDWAQEGQVDMPLTDADVMFLDNAAKAGKLDNLCNRLATILRDRQELAQAEQLVTIKSGLNAVGGQVAALAEVGARQAAMLAEKVDRARPADGAAPAAADVVDEMARRLAA